MTTAAATTRDGGVDTDREAAGAAVLDTRLLEKFPFDPPELRRLLESHDMYDLLMGAGDGRGSSGEGHDGAVDGGADGGGRGARLILHSLASSPGGGGRSGEGPPPGVGSTEDAPGGAAAPGAEPPEDPHAALVRYVEGTILPPGFGAALLEEAIAGAFVCLSPGGCDGMDEAQREERRRLEAFLEGMACATGRRGPSQSLRLLYVCCRRLKSGGTDASADGGAGGFAVDAEELVGLSYRLALAARALRLSDGVREEDGDALRELADLPDLADTAAASASGSGSSGVAAASLRRFAAAEASTDRASPPDGAAKREGAGVPVRCFVDWADDRAPHLHSALGTFLHLCLFPTSPFPPSRVPFAFPRTVDCRGDPCGSEVLGDRAGMAAFGVACAGPNLGGKWHRLYSTDVDGRSFLTMRHALVGYSGPTVTLIRPAASSLTTGSDKPSAFGYYTSSPWKESPKHYGSSDCFLFRLRPDVEVFRPTGDGENYMYLRSHASGVCGPGGVGPRRGRRETGPCYGIGIGGTAERPRLFLTESMDGCRANHSMLDKTFGSGSLLPDEWDSAFDVDVLEVWGVGPDDDVRKALRDRGARRSVDDANRRKNGKVDRRQFLEDFQTGVVINKLYDHRTLSRGRHSFSVDDQHGGYKLNGKD